MWNVSSKLLIFALGLTLTGSACKSAVYDNAPSAIASASPAPSGTINTTSVVNGAITPEKLSQAYLPLAGGTMTGTLTLAGAPTGANDAATKAYVDSAVAGGSGSVQVSNVAYNLSSSAANSSNWTSTSLAPTQAQVEAFGNYLQPPGSILSYGGASAPSGFLLCDGTSYLRADYQRLFNAIGTAYGAVDGTHFNVPDLRGRFLRGTDNMGTGAAARDPNTGSRTAMNAGGNINNNVGSVQTDAFQGHFHPMDSDNAGGGFTNLISQAAAVSGGAGFTVGYMARHASSDGTNGTPRTSSETRPINAYVNYIIKF